MSSRGWREASVTRRATARIFLHSGVEGLGSVMWAENKKLTSTVSTKLQRCGGGGGGWSREGKLATDTLIFVDIEKTAVRNAGVSGDVFWHRFRN